MPNIHSSELCCGVIQWLVISKCGRDRLEGFVHMNRQERIFGHCSSHGIHIKASFAAHAPFPLKGEVLVQAVGV